MNYLLYNPKAQNNKASNIIIEIEKKHLDVTYEKIDITSINLDAFFENIDAKSTITLLGGDGTLSIFASLYQKYKIKNKIYFYHGGSGNDFFNDIGKNQDEIELNKYIQNIPTILVNNKEHYFINGIGYGIDGVVCEEADILKEKGKKHINYTLIALKLLLHKFKTYTATITVDGKTETFNNVWLAASMNGRFYGGGMMVAPDQDRLSGGLSLIVMHAKSRIKALWSFRLIFSGKLSSKKKLVSVFKGKNIEVNFNRGCALQIDGEVIKNVTNYKAYYK